MAGQLLIRDPRVQRAADGKGWVILHPSNDAILGVYDYEDHAREVARALSCLGYRSAGLRAWRVDLAIGPDGNGPFAWEGSVTVWARSSDGADEVGRRLARKHGGAWDGSDVWTRKTEALDDPRYLTTIPPVTIDTWADVEGKPGYKQQTGYRPIADFVADLDARIDASDLSIEYRGICISFKYDGKAEAGKTIPEVLGGKPWRLVVSAVQGHNEGHYIHVMAIGTAPRDSVVAPSINLYTVKCLSGEVEADAIAAALRLWIEG